MVSLDSSEEQPQPGVGQTIPTTVAPVGVYWSVGITEGFTALSFKSIQVVKVLSYKVAQLTLDQNGKCHN